jgi:hypothetical protein
LAKVLAIRESFLGCTRPPEGAIGTFYFRKGCDTADIATHAGEFDGIHAAPSVLGMGAYVTLPFFSCHFLL